MPKGKIDLEQFKKTLLAERDRLQGKERRIDKRNSAESGTAEISELSDYDDHPADVATETENRATDLALDESINVLLDRIEEALRKIEKGTYGACDRCGSQIHPERLKAVPYATLCIECQDIVEEQG